MADKKKRPSRLGRGLSSLMAAPADLQPVPVEAEPTDKGSADQAAPSQGQDQPKPPDQAETGTARPSDRASTPSDTPTPSQPPTEAGGGGLVRLPIADIHPNRHQPRQSFDEAALKGLAASIRNDGLMQPIVVRAANDGGAGTPYELIAGERRWRAAKLAGLAAVPAIVHELSDEQSAEWALVENLQREDLNPIEKAEAFKRLADTFHLPHAKIAERVGLERSTVTNLLRLLDLSDFCRGLVRENLLSMGQARAIAGLPDAATQQQLAQRAVREGMSVRQVEQEVRKLLHSPAEVTVSPKKQAANNLVDLEKQIGEQLGTRVKLKTGRKKGAGTLAIDFYSLDEFDALLARMDVKTD